MAQLPPNWKQIGLTFVQYYYTTFDQNRAGLANLYVRLLRSPSLSPLLLGYLNSLYHSLSLLLTLSAVTAFPPRPDCPTVNPPWLRRLSSSLSVASKFHVIV